MTKTTFTCGDYRITSYGNGTAYEITNYYRTIFLQGDDANQLRQDTDDFSNPSVLGDFFFEYFSS